MAISAITPAAGSLIVPGEVLSFTIDDTYTSMVIEVEVSSGWEYAYDSALGGAQAGYTVSVVDNGSTHTFSVSRDAGFDLDTMVFRVTENETGSSATTNTTYYLTTTLSFPQGVNPYYGTFTGDLIVTDDDVEVSTAVGWLDLVGFTITDEGNGKVRVESAGGAGSVDYVSNVATSTILGRVTAGTGNSEELTPTQVRTLINVEDGATAAGATGDAYATSHEADSTAHTAAEIVNTPAGGIAATDVQAALNELDGDKVAGPASATDNSIARFDGTTGKLIQDGGGATLSDNGHLQLLASDAGLHLQERVTGPASQAATGHYWVKAGALPKPIYTDDVGTESELIGSAIAGQIAALTHVTPAAGDYVLIEDASDSNNKKHVLVSELSGSGTDADAIHDNVAGEIAALTLVTVASGDHILIEDASDANNKKRIAASDLIQTGDVVGPGSATDNAVARFDSTTGKLIQDSSVSTLGDQSGLLLDGTDAHVAMKERSSAPTDSAARGFWWVKDGTLQEPIFTDDQSTDYRLRQIVSVPVGGSYNAADTTNYYGSDVESPWNTSASSVSKSTGPTIGPADVPAWVAPYACKLTRVALWYRPGSGTVAGNLSIWKCTWTTGSASFSATKLGADIAVATGTNANRYDISTTFSSSNDVAAGDSIYVLFLATATGAIHFMGSLTFDMIL
jgi:hypothetical protein